MLLTFLLLDNIIYILHVVFVFFFVFKMFDSPPSIFFARATMGNKRRIAHWREKKENARSAHLAQLSVHTFGVIWGRHGVPIGMFGCIGLALRALGLRLKHHWPAHGSKAQLARAVSG